MLFRSTASITLGNQKREYKRDDSIFVPMHTYHKIENSSAKDLIVIEVGVGGSAGLIAEDVLPIIEDFVKLEPVIKDYLWGGNNLQQLFGKGDQKSCIAESWELSAHPSGVSKVASGELKGMSFAEYLTKIGKEALGWKCQPFERFPLLVKFIDATHALSVQVHPDDAYAMAVEGDYGKNEMWYVMQAQPNASIYLGFKEQITKAQCKKRIADGTLIEVLNQVPVKAGDVIFVKAGTVHAILAGVVILEIQQSSNATYRLFDYDRVDKDGHKRSLHIEKALDNINFQYGKEAYQACGEIKEEQGNTKQLLGECKYFSATMYQITNAMELSFDDASFSAITFVEGSGEMLSNTLEIGRASCRERVSSPV